MPEMRREKTGTTDYWFPGKNLKKELGFRNQFQMSKSPSLPPSPQRGEGKGEGKEF